MFREFDQGFEHLCTWMDTIEINLQRIPTTSNANDSYSHQQSINIEMDIENHSAAMSNLLSLGHSLLNETDMSPRSLESLSRTVQTLEQRWHLLKELINKQKSE